MYRKETSNREIVYNVIVAVILLAIIAALFGYMLVMLRDSFIDLASELGQQNQANAVCIQNGYSDYEQVRTKDGWKFYCVGIVDGSTKTVKVEDLLKEE